jgi:hypothetical protein
LSRASLGRHPDRLLWQRFPARGLATPGTFSPLPDRPIRTIKPDSMSNKTVINLLLYFGTEPLFTMDMILMTMFMMPSSAKTIAAKLPAHCQS